MSVKHHPLARFVPALVIALVVIAVVVGLYFIKKMLDDKPGSAKKAVQQITVIQPPPPPPPPPEQKIEEPPPPEEPKIEEPKPVPEELPDTPSDEPPPGADLGVDADGGAGGDGFGLVGRKGGRSLLGGNNPFGWYSNAVLSDISDVLNENTKLRKRAYRTTLKIWLTPGSNSISKVALATSTGDEALDKEIVNAVLKMGKLSEKAPLEMPQPLMVNIKARL